MTINYWAGSATDQAAEAAMIYRANFEDAPLEHVVIHCGCSRRTASRRIALAREIGLLPKTRQGRKLA